RGQPLAHAEPVWSVAFSPDGRTLLTGCGTKDHLKGEFRLWDVATGVPQGPPQPQPYSVSTVAFSPDGRHFLTHCAQQVCLWDSVTRRLLGPPLKHENGKAAIMPAVFSPHGRTVLTGSKDGTARLWRVATCEPLAVPLRHRNVVEAVAFSPDGRA